MAKVKCYYDKGITLGITAKPSFYAYPIEVDENVLKQAESIRSIIEAESLMRRTASFPSGAQDLADALAAEMSAVMKTQKRRTQNVQRNDEE